MSQLIAAVFPSHKDAENALDWLKDAGVPEDSISVIARQDEAEQYLAQNAAAPVGAHEATPAEHDAETAGSGALTGVGVGAAVGAIFGLAAAAIPGIGPFITAGALASILGATGGAAAAGAIVGGVSGGLAGSLNHWGLSEDHSHYYAEQIEHGGIFLGVDLSRSLLLPETVVEVFHRYHGRLAETPD